MEIDGTRTRVARLVGQEGPITVSCLAERLGLTPAAVRRHLDAMLVGGVVEAREIAAVGAGRRGRGRPAKAFVLTEAGHTSLSSDYDDLAVQALRFLADEHGRSAVEQFATRRFADLERRVAPAVEGAGQDRQARARALAAALNDEGYAASTRPLATGTAQQAVQLCQGHCPVQHAAAEFPELCEAETKVFARLLGTDVRRLATLAHGDHVCTTHVPDRQTEQQQHDPQTETETAPTAQSGRTAR
ncbi:transcriptional regulator [Angustibacter speluncae]